jgi:hypothetical protein
MELAIQNRRTNPLIWLIFIGILIFLGWVFTRKGTTEVSDGITVRYSAHAEGHGAEGDMARDCFKQRGTYMWFHQAGSNRYARICIFEDGFVALQILVYNVATKIFDEVSSYVPHLKDSGVEGVIRWLVKECGWTKYMGGF